MAAADEAELVHMVATAAAHDDGPIALRYPRGEGVGVAMPERRRAAGDRPRPDRQRGHHGRASVARHAACGMPESRRRTGAPAASRPRSPMRALPSRSTTDLVLRLAREHEVLITIEEGSAAASAPPCCRRYGRIAALRA
jgi:1-deoxy-D-xylulose-5-phosphate synthase